VQAIEINTSLEEVREIVAKDGHSRFPVYEGVPDNVIGTLYAKDLLSCDLADPKTTLRGLLRPAYYAPTTQPINVLLREFQRQKVHMAIVIDEFGGMAGIVTLEDIIEEIVGEIEDEYDTGEGAEWERRRDSIVVDGKMRLDEFNDEFGRRLPEEGVETVAGFIIRRLGRIPAAGDSVRHNGLVLRVLEATDRRVVRVEVKGLGQQHVDRGGRDRV
jgi:CBS domain containing-hemolysin-like protein